MKNTDEPIKLTVKEDAMYQKLIGHGLNNGLTEEQAEKETIEEMVKYFPRLKELTKNGFTISLEIIND